MNNRSIVKRSQIKIIFLNKSSLEDEKEKKSFLLFRFSSPGARLSTRVRCNLKMKFLKLLLKWLEQKNRWKSLIEMTNKETNKQTDRNKFY